MKDLLTGMLDTYNYEATLLNTTNAILRTDLFRSAGWLRFHRSKGIVERAREIVLILSSLFLVL